MKYDVYDFNGTIYKGNLTKDIIFFVLMKHPQYFFIIIWATFIYIFKIIDKKTYMNKLYSFVKKIKDIYSFIDDFWHKNHMKLNEFWIEKENHKNDIIVSDECEFILEYILKKYNVGKIIGSKYSFKELEFLDNDFSIEKKIQQIYKLYYKVKINLYININSFINIRNIKNIYYIQKDNIIFKSDYKFSFIRVILCKLNSVFNNREIFCYLVSGALTVVVNLITKCLLLITIFNEENVFELQTTIIISWIIAVIFAYFINRIYVFKSATAKKLNEFIKFLGSRVLTLLIEMFLTWVLITLCQLNVTMIITFIQLIIIILNYSFSKIFIFSKKNSF